MHKHSSSAFIYTYAKDIFLCQTSKKFSRCSQGSNPSPFTCETEAKCCPDDHYLELVNVLVIDRLDAIFYLLYIILYLGLISPSALPYLVTPFSGCSQEVFALIYLHVFLLAYEYLCLNVKFPEIILNILKYFGHKVRS